MVRSNTIVGDRAHPRGMVVSRIVRGNIPVQNGVVHLIDKPLMIVARTLYEYILVSYFFGILFNKTFGKQMSNKNKNDYLRK